jgi:hypothetical protein
MGYIIPGSFFTGVKNVLLSLPLGPSRHPEKNMWAPKVQDNNKLPVGDNFSLWELDIYNVIVTNNTCM